ncbi:MAG: prepilin-type N-terminal cleavage/methylation domain-containing protein [Litorimonas sp.]
MPILAIGSRAATGSDRATGERPSREAGFSLVELLAVLAILSLMAGAVVLNLPETRSETARASEAMEARLSRFLDDGDLAGEMRALGADVDALVLYRHDGLSWQRAGEIAWPDDARIRLRDGDQVVELTEIAAPRFLFEPYGSVPDFTLTLTAREANYVLAPTPRGRIGRTVER